MASELQKPTSNDMGGLPQLHCRQRGRGVPPRGAAPRRAGAGVSTAALRVGARKSQ